MRELPQPPSPGRARNMRAIRRVDTRPEVQLRRALHARGLRFRKDLRLNFPSGDAVRPDVVFTRRRIAIFVDGCFWHSCPLHGRIPSVNQQYWEPKLRRTTQRDLAADILLESNGWTVVRYWEHETVEDIMAHLSPLFETVAGVDGD